MPVRFTATPAPRSTRVRVAPLVTLLPAVLVAACSRGESRPAHATVASRDSAHARGAVPRDVTLPGVTASRPAYVVRPAPDAGRITGTVQIEEPPPPDTTVTPSADDVHTCGRSLTLPTVETKGGAVVGAVVWLIGVGAGKALPDVRRTELALDDCRLRPHLIAAVAGGALNVHGIDELDARLRFTRVEGGSTTNGASDDGPGAIVLRVTTTDAGQVVPSERVVATPGTVEVRGELQPWLRAWVLAFDHPYFVTTDANGTFTLDGVPPGTYRLVAWHDRLGRTEQQVTVGAGGSESVTLKLGSSR